MLTMQFKSAPRRVSHPRGKGRTDARDMRLFGPVHFRCGRNECCPTNPQSRPLPCMRSFQNAAATPKSILNRSFVQAILPSGFSCSFTKRLISGANLRRSPKHRGTSAFSENRELRSADASSATSSLREIAEIMRPIKLLCDTRDPGSLFAGSRAAAVLRPLETVV